MMRRIDEQYTRTPFYGVRKITDWLRKGDPGAGFSVETFPASGKKEKRSKKERKGRPVENDAPDGNPTQQDFHSGLQNPSGLAHFPPARQRAYQRDFSEPDSTLKKPIICPKDGEHLPF
jgi:hypothetical protein